MARKLGLIDRHVFDTNIQVIDLSTSSQPQTCAFYRSGFDKAVAVIVDGVGTFIQQ